MVEPLAKVLQSLGSKHVLVVHAEDGLDEISIASETHIAELMNGHVSTYSISPTEFAMEHDSLNEIVVSDVQQSLQMVNDVFANKAGAALDIVRLNAGAALYASDKASSLKQGVCMASDALASGDAKNKFQQFIEFTKSYS